jgi:hypothetical protein
MAVYKIFPEQSATLYSYYPSLNSGNDEILDLSTYLTIDGTNQVSRPIIQFSQNEIEDIYYNKVNGAEYEAHLRLSLANASQIPLNYTINCYPLYWSWDRGTGRLANSPITTDGAGWRWYNFLSGSAWYYPDNIPAPGLDYYDDGTNYGGGIWYQGYSAYQDFTNVTSKDIDLDITSMYQGWIDYTINNAGVILKHDNSLEFTTSSYFELKYFSANTHTIYPPCLEIRWDDWSYNTSLTVVTSPQIVATLANNQSEYQQDSVQRFRVNVRDRYPARAFSTTSVYLVNKALPEESYYQIKDLDTEEIVVDYDTTYTQISCDDTSNYFDVYMNGLEPERYYKILIKTTIDGTTLILDDNYYFKVIR